MADRLQSVIAWPCHAVPAEVEGAGRRLDRRRELHLSFLEDVEPRPFAALGAEDPIEQAFFHNEGLPAARAWMLRAIVNATHGPSPARFPSPGRWEGDGRGQG